MREEPERFTTTTSGQVELLPALHREPRVWVGPNGEDMDVDDGYDPPSIAIGHGEVVAATLTREEMIHIAVWLIQHAAEAPSGPATWERLLIDDGEPF